MTTIMWHRLTSILLGGVLLIGGVAQAHPVEDPGTEPEQAQQTLSLVGSIAAGEPHDLVVTCAGYNCGREHDLVYYDIAQDADGWRYVKFVDAETLQVTGEGIKVTGFSTVGPLLYDPYYRQVYAFGEQDECDDWGSNCYEQARVYILSNRERTGFFTINDAFNDPDPVDKFYSIEGVAIKPKGTDTGPTTLVVDSTPNGNLDVVRMQADGEDVQSVERYSYRDSLCGEETCNWWTTQGNSLAIDYGQAMLYLADNNSYSAQVRAFRFTGVVEGQVSLIPVGEEALCWVFLQSVAVAQGRNTLYAPSGCQSFEQGSTVVVDTDTNEPKKTITYRYGDQGIIAVDPHDPRRVFITTSDANGEYDPDQLLRLHMLYDDVVVASLPLLPGFGIDNKALLRDMVFDPVSSRLFISVGQSILVVDVGGVPPAEMWPEPVTSSITPEHGGELKAADGSATFYFSTDTVSQTAQVTYTEKAPHTAVSALTGLSALSDAGLAAAGTVLRSVRTFELTGVISGTTMPLDDFNSSFTLQVETTDKELAGVITSTLALYWWDGSQWRKQYDVSDVPLGSTYSNHTGLFALMGESHVVYLPLVQRSG